MRKKVAFVHIGKHKTGSTSIQHYLSQHLDYFLEQGIRVITNDIMPGGCDISGSVNNAEIAHLFLREDLKTPVRLSQTIPLLSDDEKKNLYSN